MPQYPSSFAAQTLCLVTLQHWPAEGLQPRSPYMPCEPSPDPTVCLSLPSRPAASLPFLCVVLFVSFLFIYLPLSLDVLLWPRFSPFWIFISLPPASMWGWTQLPGCSPEAGLEHLSAMILWFLLHAQEPLEALQTRRQSPRSFPVLSPSSLPHCSMKAACETGSPCSFTLKPDSKSAANPRPKVQGSLLKEVSPLKTPARSPCSQAPRGHKTKVTSAWLPTFWDTPGLYPSRTSENPPRKSRSSSS